MNSLTPEQFARVRAVFEAAIDRPPAERRAYAAGACAGDAELLGEVERMLAAEEHTNTLLPREASPSSSSATNEEGRFPAGTVLAGRYRILGLLGRGGMGEVYKAFDIILNQVVALKFLSPTHISEAALARFRNEVRIARQVSHPNVCRVYDLGMVEGLHFLSMEFIDGEDLASLLRRIGHLPQDKATEFTRKICAGLGAAHERGVLHRDLKPANIMIDGRGQPRITDFGLAGLQQEIPLSDLRSGTPAYMSPEQKAGKEVTPRSDIYALGLVLHEMFTGKQRGSDSKTAQSTPSELVKDLDPAIERLILRCLEEDPARRPQSALRVAMSLPGADPIAAALAAGETPSPEMVAASQEKEGFSPRTAILCFLLMLAAWGSAVVWQSRTSLAALGPMAFPPDAMAEKARQVIRSARYETSADSVVYGFDCCDAQRAEYVASLPADQQKQALRQHRPAIFRFYYRQQQKSRETLSRSALFPDETPPPYGQIRVEMDALGGLLRLEVSPQRDDPSLEDPVDWEVFFGHAGLDLRRFVPVSPTTNLAMPLDQRFTWEGDWGPDRQERIRVEAGLRRGRVVFFQVWPLLSLAADPTRVVWLDWTRFAIVLTLAVAALFFTIRNGRQGRQDRRGVLIIVVLLASAMMMFFALGPRHIDLTADRPPFLYALVLFGLPLYLASAPQIRRYRPDASISWSRLCTGKSRNGLVASHLLAAVTLSLALPAVIWPLVYLMGKKTPYWVMGLQGLAFVGSFGGTVAWGAFWAAIGLTTGLAFAFAATQLRLVISRVWLADILAAVLLSFLFAPPSSAASLLVAAVWLADLWLLRRLGFLAFFAAWIPQTAMVNFTFSATGWIAPYTIGFHLVPVAIGAWALWVILSEKQQGPSLDPSA